MRRVQQFSSTHQRGTYILPTQNALFASCCHKQGCKQGKNTGRKRRGPVVGLNPQHLGQISRSTMTMQLRCSACEMCISAHHSGLVMTVSTTVPGGGLARP